MDSPRQINRMNESTLQFALAIFALPAFGLLMGIGATIAERLRTVSDRPSQTDHAIPRHVSVSLPATMVDAMNARIERGDYASMDEVILDGLRVLIAEEQRTDK